ncbi:YraN family protein [Alicyclobacillus sp.]|uniref:YraN family protein n=1 Tax=Alicyclobacillus sp. TaxID=61169 RepID=UPI0025C2BBA9|nr:YraN family protein [Alicyclobacillus sp.]MCL6515654.1 YraN family protein [Alicyclobacillus sp.]
MDARGRLGRFGERFAAQYVERVLGWRVERTRGRCRFGELDLVTRTPQGELVVIEVRTRSTDGFGTPLESVTPTKQRRLQRAIRRLVAELPDPKPSMVRVDVIGVTVRNGRVAAFDHVRGACDIPSDGA